MPKGEAVNSMFAGIAGRYDRANHLLSGGIDAWWRRRLVKAAKRENPQVVVDLATGSGDVAFALERRLGNRLTIKGLDFCQPMLDQANLKKGEGSRVEFAVGDCLNLPLESDSVDVLTISFGFRNLEDRAKGLQEMRRVLKPGGALFILEFSQPYAVIKPFYYAYLKGVLPWVAKWVTGDKGAYDYLAGSIEDFPSADSLESEIAEQLFRVEHIYRLTGGVVAIHQARKKA